MSRILYTLCGRDPARPFSPHCWKIVLALHHKGLAFTERPVTFTAVPQIEGGATKTVPLLRDGDTLVVDSYKIALYLDETYPDGPSLFGGPGGAAMARFVESFTQTLVHPAVVRIALKQIHDLLGLEDQAYFRSNREQVFGKTLEQVVANRDQEIADFPGHFKVLRHMLGRQPFIGGSAPLFADYILFGALQWLRGASGQVFLPEDDPVRHWFERCLDLHDGAGRKVA